MPQGPASAVDATATVSVPVQAPAPAPAAARKVPPPMPINRSASMEDAAAAAVAASPPVTSILTGSYNKDKFVGRPPVAAHESAPAGSAVSLARPPVSTAAAAAAAASSAPGGAATPSPARTLSHLNISADGSVSVTAVGSGMLRSASGVRGSTSKIGKAPNTWDSLEGPPAPIQPPSDFAFSSPRDFPSRQPGGGGGGPK